jgi:hypothetical protein
MVETAKNKRKLFETYKEETLKQYTFVQEKQPERFLESTQICEDLIKQIDNCQNPITSQEEQEIKNIIREILRIREQISLLIPTAQKYFSEQLKAERQRSEIQRRYGDQLPQPPSIFFDKRK